MVIVAPASRQATTHINDTLLQLRQYLSFTRIWQARSITCLSVMHSQGLRPSIRIFSSHNAFSRLHIRGKATETLKQGDTKVEGGTATQTLLPLIQSLFAIGAAVGTVSVAAFVVEQATGDDVRSFDLQSDRFDQNTFMGRFSKMLLGCDPRLLFYSAEDVQRSLEMVKNSKQLIESPPDGVRNIHRTLWEAHRISSAALNGDEYVPLPFRMSGYVPFNGPVCAAMVCSSSTPSLLFWNWINQSQNAGVNYFNRNAASNMSDETLMKSYAGAVGAALTVAFGLSTFVQRKYDPVRAKQVMRYVAFPSTVVASSLNCYIVRSPEMDTGVPMMDERGNMIQMRNGEDNTSRIAAAQGVYATTASRAILNIPVLLVPPVLLSSVPLFRNAIARNPAMTVPVTVYVLLTCFGVGLPAACAVFPQIVEVSTKDLEEKFHNLYDANGGKVEKIYFNKGL